MSKIKIILATYNGERYLARLIESVLESSDQNWQLKISDDGSTDRTIEIAEKYQERCPGQISVSRNPINSGCTKNFLNALKKEADGSEAEYFMFCDQDDVWRPEKISEARKAMERTEKRYGKECPCAVFTDAYVTDENLGIISHSFMQNSKLNPHHTALSRLLMENKCIGCTMIMNAALVKILDKIPENARFHDWWMALLASAFGHVAYLNKQTLYYCQHQENVVGSENFFDYVKQRLTALSEDRMRLRKTGLQAEEFLELYGSRLPKEKKEVVAAFASLSREGFIKRRCLIIRHGFYKTGLLRNLGVLLLI